MSDQDFWQRQETKPLYPDAIWAKPERKSQAGKLLIVGGNGLEFSKTQAAYGLALQNGIGECKVVIPKTAHKIVGLHPDIEFAQATSQGGFSLEAKTELLGYIDWPDTILFPGELGRSSETAQILEHTISSTNKRIILTRDAIDLMKANFKPLLERNNTTLVLSLAQLQDIFKAVNWPHPIRFQMSLGELTEQLHQLTKTYASNIVTYFAQNLLSASNGNVVTTRLSEEPESWRLKVSSNCSTWLTWTSPNEALATACWQFKDETSII